MKAGVQTMQKFLLASFLVWQSSKLTFGSATNIKIKSLKRLLQT